MSWFVLAPTIVIALIISVIVLVKPGQPARINAVTKGEGEGALSSGPLPTLNTWLRLTRQPVWPIDSADLRDRVNRGIKVGAVMGFVATPLALTGESIFTGVLAGIGAMILAVFFAAFGGVMSVAHTLVLRVMPYRGPIVSTALGAFLGIAAAFVMWHSLTPGVPLVSCGAIYGFMIGMIDSWMPQGKEGKPRKLPAKA